jgi:hypothetical protein
MGFWHPKILPEYLISHSSYSFMNKPSNQLPYWFLKCPLFYQTISLLPEEKSLQIPENHTVYALDCWKTSLKPLNETSYQRSGVLSSSVVLSSSSLGWKHFLHLITFISPSISFVPFFISLKRSLKLLWWKTITRELLFLERKVRLFINYL